MNEWTTNQFVIVGGITFLIISILVISGIVRYNKKQKENSSLKLQSKDTIRESLIALTEEKAKDKESVKASSTAKKIVVQKDVPKEVSIKESLPTHNWFERLKGGLRKTHTQLVTNLDEFFLSKKDKATRAEIHETLFELLVQADVGVKTSEYLVDRVKGRLTPEAYLDPKLFKGILREEIFTILTSTKENPKGVLENPLQSLSEKKLPHVVLMVGVNGVGKTTTTGKLAFKSHLKGQKVVIGAADTFRAAAVEQLAIWAQRSNAEMIRLKEGTDPASVAFETVKKAAENGSSVCLIDTAGRLQNRQDLMQELAKISRVIAKENPEAPHEVLLVLDATTGQNALQQARIFQEVVNITGLVLTKLDGTAKGGIAIAIAAELKVPIRYVGVGEAVEDLEVFEAHEFVNALFSEEH
ncbi:signal recognition particle-docking protein FtsY [Pigmentibacter sp. JX0631]|uniref:signal recognition particle-docking protein FtsY n=1 Tax=Pigmentibacter sp. JX0631 TaxID=2976982 RepID=UPI00246987EF|nr:signal recognition particle-docking protein FtsY [Pigmentibacter sp. JX0631]WGL60413.1 signal recognition particle-docking protein FtsY [Pigmentibacter sp. JX0631]